MDGFTPLASWGVPGFLLSIAFGVIIYQNRKIEGLYKQKEAIQDKRLEDIKEIGDKYNSAMGDFSQTSKLLLAKIDGRSEA